MQWWVLPKDGASRVQFQRYPHNGVYRDAVTGHEISVSNGSIRFTVAPSSAGDYVLDGPGMIGDLGADSSRPTPKRFPGRWRAMDGGTQDPPAEPATPRIQPQSGHYPVNH